MAIKISQVRAAVASQISALAGFNEAKIPPEYLGRIQNTIAHKAFGVAVAQVGPGSNERQRRVSGYYLSTKTRVKFAYRLRPHDTYPTDYDASFDALEDVIAAVLSTYASIRQGVVMRFDGATHTISDSIEYIIHELNFTTYNTI